MNNRYIESSYYDTSCYKSRKKQVCNFYDIKEYIFRRFGAFFHMVNRNFFIKEDLYFVENIFFEDVVTHVKLLIKAKKISFVDENLYVYRFNRKGSIMDIASVDHKVKDVFIFLKEVEKFLISQNLQGDLTSEYNVFFNEQINFHMKRIKDPNLQKEFIKNADLVRDESTLMHKQPKEQRINSYLKVLKRSRTRFLYSKCYRKFKFIISQIKSSSKLWKIRGQQTIMYPNRISD